VELDVAEKVAVVAMPANVKAVVAVPDAKSSADVQVSVMSSALKISLIDSYSHFRYLYYEKKV
jgi:hypothetical protein